MRLTDEYLEECIQIAETKFKTDTERSLKQGKASYK
jgi:hypothetical protein